MTNVKKSAGITATANPTTVSNSRMRDYRAHLKTITNGLIEMAKAAGRTNFKVNQLLKECYNLVDAELDTYEGWINRGAHVRKGQHAYLFWGKPVQTEAGFTYCPVNFLFAREQVMIQPVDSSSHIRAQEEYLYK